ncbi:MAG: glycine oxidase ThiO [Alphaproteobacteria bacterium]
MIVIVGGGVSGLAIGWRLAQAGETVTVFERNKAGMESTWAAAGMLAPQIEAEYGEEMLLPLAMASHKLWPDFAKELIAETGIPIDYREEGTIQVSLDRDEQEQLDNRFSFLSGNQLEVEKLSAYEVRRLEPHISRAVTGGIYSPQDHQVDNRALAVALKMAFEKAGGILREQCSVEEIVIGKDCVTGIVVNGEKIKVDHVVVAAGAWSRNIPGIPEVFRPPVRPLKGQMLALEMPESAPLITHVIWGPGNSIVSNVYLAPKSDGRLIVGATVEEMGFDKRMTGGGLLEILRAAWEVLPGIYDLPVIDSWSGLRPASRDDAPILGSSGISGLTYATGHHRNGILLSPITASEISSYIIEGKKSDLINNFSVGRFKRV